ncbi:hypothetical protein Nepgr_017414 [Nepenthes gracilis]|uniref:Uncharacterized protein n=1 Tax=Nepenthes gracilis TaxID=150966 RepID=A0AAD3SPD8_NEPGR|nr:hypothetical protein Nepgr_017414 [Nepenthes gracilis]
MAIIATKHLHISSTAKRRKAHPIHLKATRPQQNLTPSAHPCQGQNNQIQYLYELKQPCQTNVNQKFRTTQITTAQKMGSSAFSASILCFIPKSAVKLLSTGASAQHTRKLNQHHSNAGQNNSS